MKRFLVGISKNSIRTSLRGRFARSNFILSHKKGNCFGHEAYPRNDASIVFRNTLACIFLLFTFCFSLPAQQIWYFGNGAGIKFSKTGVQPLHDGKIYTNEGCSAGYDEKGNLLFYTDGVTVWNKNHSIIDNGEKLNGNYSTTQSALVVPKPGNKFFFYIFTADTSAGQKGICYSLLNISTNAVISKNQKLFSPGTEKLTAVSHSNGKDIWVIAHQWNSNNFLSFPVTEKGIGAPVISSVGIIHKETGSGRNRESIGEMKFSPDGKKIAVAVCYRSKDNLEILDFDNSTGKISNSLSLSVSGFPYGLCFSPDNFKLYISFLKGANGIVQYDLLSKQFVGIVVNEKENTYGSLQMGTDEKIYVARTENYLDVISFPNKTGTTCGYIKNAVNLSPASSAFGLPNILLGVPSSQQNPTQPANSPPSGKLEGVDCSKIIETPFSKKDASYTTEIVACEDKYTLHAKNFGASFNWSTMESTQKVIVNTTGIYKVSISKDGCMLIDSVRIRFRKDGAVFRYLSAFNPESEFLNSEFYYSIEEIYDFDLKVFDRENKIIFETKNPELKWNGKNPKGKFVPDGEYDWEVKFRPQCPKDAKHIIQNGKVTVTRNKK